jgi:hypothetical protein
MRVWNRSTRKLLLHTIPTEVQSTLDEHIEQYNLGPILKDYLICVETTSHKQKKKGLFGGGVAGIKIPEHVVQYGILTPNWLVICAQSLGKKTSTAALSVQLKDATVEDYSQTADYNIIPDSGVYITGTFTGRVGMQGRQQIRYFMGLGEDRDASDFKDILFEGIQKTRR